MKWYPWLNDDYRRLIGECRAGRGHHALLLHSLAGNGQEVLVYALSRWLMCQQRQGDKSCGACHSCRLMLAGTHPDWQKLTVEKGKSSLGIERIRQVIEQLYSHAQQDGAKVVWLPQVEQLTEAASHALLKTLEEPPEGTYFLLECCEPWRLLPTLRSRCLYWHLRPPTSDLSVTWLNQQQPGDRQQQQTALRLNGGAALAALQLLQPEQWQQRQTLCHTLGSALTSGDMLSLLACLNHDDVAVRLHWLCSLLLDAAKWQQGARAQLVNLDQQVLIEQWAHWPATALHRLLSQWTRCRQQLLNVVGVNRELILTEQLLQTEQFMAF